MAQRPGGDASVGGSGGSMRSNEKSSMSCRSVAGILLCVAVGAVEDEMGCADLFEFGLTKDEGGKCLRL
jgi:hypothetical protein